MSCSHRYSAGAVGGKGFYSGVALSRTVMVGEGDGQGKNKPRKEGGQLKKTKSSWAVIADIHDYFHAMIMFISELLKTR